MGLHRLGLVGGRRIRRAWLCILNLRDRRSEIADLGRRRRVDVERKRKIEKRIARLPQSLLEKNGRRHSDAFVFLRVDLFLLYLYFAMKIVLDLYFRSTQKIVR